MVDDLKIKIDDESFATHALFLLVAIFVNPLWGWFTPRFLLEGAYDGPINRALGAGVAFIALFFFSFVKNTRHLSSHFLHINSFVLMGHYIWLCYMNDFHSVYTNGIYIPMVALLVVCESVKYLIGFAIFVPVLCSAILLTDSPQTDPLFFLLGVVTVNTISCIASFLRISANNKVKEIASHQLKLMVKSEVSDAKKKQHEEILRLIGGIAHEVNNPLMIISGVNDLISVSDKSNKVLIEKNLDRSRSASQRIARIIRDLHSIAFGSYSDRLEMFQIGQLLKMAISQVEPSLMTKQPAIKVGDLNQMVLVNPVTISSAIAKVLTNAYQAIDGQANGEVIIASPLPGEVDISNNGPMIESHVRELIFDPFFTSREVGKGVGLGLNVAKSAASYLGGELLLKDSTSEWTTFTLRFPVQPK